MPRERGLPGWAVAAILVVVWEVVGRLGLVASGALPAPSAILVRFWADRSDYPAHVWATVQASTLGFLAGNAVAVLAGIAFVLSPRLLRLVHRTNANEFVRSKSEVIVANILTDLGLDYAYEKRFEGSDGSARFPDFTVEDDDTGETTLIEHLGMLSDPGYKRAWGQKLEWYAANGVSTGGGGRARLVIR